jgi:hypothetical protein
MSTINKHVTRILLSSAAVASFVAISSITYMSVANATTTTASTTSVTAVVASGTVSILSQVTPQMWYQTFDQYVVTSSTGPVSLYLVSSSSDQQGFYLGKFLGTSKKFTATTTTVTATDTVSFLTTFTIPAGKYYVEAVLGQMGGGSYQTLLQTVLRKKVSIPAGPSAISSSTVQITVPPLYIVVTKPITTQTWSQLSSKTVGWIADFKRSSLVDTDYAGVELALPYGTAPAKGDLATAAIPGIIFSAPGTGGCTSITSSIASSIQSINSTLPSGLPTPPTPPTPSLPSGVTVSTLCNPLSSSIPGIPVVTSLPNPLGLPSPVSALNSLFGGDSAPYAVSVNVDAVAYNPTTKTYGKSYPLTINKAYLESGQTNVTPLLVKPGKYVIVVSTQLFNIKTLKINTISGTSSVITISKASIPTSL